MLDKQGPLAVPRGVEPDNKNKALAEIVSHSLSTEIQELIPQSVSPERRRRGSYVNTVRDPVSGMVRHYFRPPSNKMLPAGLSRDLPQDPDEAMARAHELAAKCVPIGISPTGAMLQDRIADVTVEMLRSCRKRAKLKGIPFALTNDDVLEMLRKQNYRCEVSGLEFRYDKGGYNDFRASHRPSLDRIEAWRGYVPGNVRLVLVAVNIAMGEWGEEFLLQLCKQIISHSRKRQIGSHPPHHHRHPQKHGCAG